MPDGLTCLVFLGRWRNAVTHELRPGSPGSKRSKEAKEAREGKEVKEAKETGSCQAACLRQLVIVSPSPWQIILSKAGLGVSSLRVSCQAVVYFTCLPLRPMFVGQTSVFPVTVIAVYARCPNASLYASRQRSCRAKCLILNTLLGSFRPSPDDWHLIAVTSQVMNAKLH